MRDRKQRKGFSLIELLIAIVVLAILGAITITAGSAAQQRARVTSAMTVFDDYKAAFNTAIMDHPGLVNDREDTWLLPDGSGDGSAYTSVEAFKRLVGYMNKSLSEEQKLVVSADGKYYESVGNDPWGGKYVLLEYPEVNGLTYWDPTTATAKASMRISIWCTGCDSDIVVPDATGVSTVRDYSKGIVIVDAAGDITSQTHGASDESIPFLDGKIHIK